MNRRFGLIDGPGSPRIHLGAACAQMVSVCLTPDDTSGDAGTQTSEVLARIGDFLRRQGSGPDRLMMAQVWLADIRDLPAFTRAWNAWIPPGHPPALSVVQAAASRRDTLVEIRVYALP